MPPVSRGGKTCKDIGDHLAHGVQPLLHGGALQDQPHGVRRLSSGRITGEPAITKDLRRARHCRTRRFSALENPHSLLYNDAAITGRNKGEQ